MIHVSCSQGLSQNSETGCSKLKIVNVFGELLYVQGIPEMYLDNNLYFLIEKRYHILMQCDGNYNEMSIFNYLLEIDIHENKYLGVLICDF